MRYEKISYDPGMTLEERVIELEDKVNILIDAVEHLHGVIERMGKEVTRNASQNKVQ